MVTWDVSLVNFSVIGISDVTHLYNTMKHLPHNLAHNSDADYCKVNAFYPLQHRVSRKHGYKWLMDLPYLLCNLEFRIDGIMKNCSISGISTMNFTLVKRKATQL